MVPGRAWFFSLRVADLCLWKDQAALNWGFKIQRYLFSIPSGILCGSDGAKMAKTNCQSCDTLRNTQLIKVSLWAQRSFASWIALCKSHNAAFFHPSCAGLLNILSIYIEGSRLHHCRWELQMSGVFWTSNNVNRCCEKQWEILMRQISSLNMKGNVKKTQKHPTKWNNTFSMMEMAF